MEKIPRLPSEDRGYNYFPPNDRITLFVSEENKKYFYESNIKFFNLIVKKVNDQGIVELYHPTIKNYGIGLANPELMKEWEFEYLLKHPDFAEKWAYSVKQDGFDPKEFLSAISEEGAKNKMY
jgi:hypothetical protein